MEELIKVLNKKYTFKYNSLSNKVYYLTNKKNHTTSYEELKDSDINTIYIKLKNKIRNLRKEDIKIYVNSNYVEDFNPLEDFLSSQNLDSSNTDYIKKLAETVKTTNDELFQKIFKKWFILVIASALRSMVINPMALIFVGKQGVGKTTWLRNLLPHNFQNYYYSGSINPSNKESLEMLATRILINLDELTSLDKSSLESFKELMTKEKVSYRKPYATTTQDFDRVASFVGSSNYKEVLVDSTGNRRFFCVEVLSMKLPPEEILLNAYLQAYFLIKENVIDMYYTNEEENLIESSNDNFRSKSKEEDLIGTILFKISKHDENALFMNATEILHHLKKRKVYISIDHIKLGRILNEYGFETKKVNGLKKYAISFENSKNKETVDYDFCLGDLKVKIREDGALMDAEFNPEIDDLIFLNDPFIEDKMEDAEILKKLNDELESVKAKYRKKI